MSIIELGAIGEFLGAIAVVATLLYLAVQVRQNAQGMQVNAEIQMWSWWSEQNRQLTLNGDMREIVCGSFSLTS